MEKFILYVGLNDKDTKRQEIATLEAYKVVKWGNCFWKNIKIRLKK